MTFPHDPQIEQAVLASMIMDQNAADIGIQMLKDHQDIFFEDRHKAIYASVHRLFNATENITVLLIKADLDNKGLLASVGGAAYLVEVIAGQYVSSANIKVHCGVLIDLWVRRGAIQLAQETLEGAESENSRVTVERLQVGSEALSERRRGSDGQGPKHVLQVFDAAAKQVGEAFLNKGLIGIDTGKHALNDATAGWRKGHQIVIGAGTSEGKSALAVDFARGALKAGHGVLFFTMEMSSEEIVNRFAANILSLDSMLIDRGHLDPDEWRAYSGLRDTLKTWPLMIDDRAGLTVTEIRATVRKAKREFPKKYGTELSLVVVDYLQLMSWSDMKEKNPSRERQVSYFSGGLRDTWKTLGVTGIVLSQLHRGEKSKPNAQPSLSDFRDSGSVEQDANVALMFWYKDRQEGNVYPDEEYVLLQVKKNRGGKRGVDVPLVFKKKYSRFEPWFPSFNGMPEVTPVISRYEPKEAG